MSDISALENQRDQALLSVESRAAVLRLTNNPDFKKIINDGFCLKECARYVQASTDPALNSEQRADALAIAQSSGHLKRFLSVVIQMGNQAERLLPELDEAIVEARQEYQGE